MNQFYLAVQTMLDKLSDYSVSDALKAAPSTDLIGTEEIKWIINNFFQIKKRKKSKKIIEQDKKLIQKMF